MEPTQDSVTLRGMLKRVRFSNESGSFAVAELAVEGRAMPVTLVGNLLSTKPGEVVEVTGRWRRDPKFGKQFQIERMYAVPPITTEGIVRYLSSGLIEGIGPVLAGRIVERFGPRTLEIIDEAPGRIREVEGIGPQRAEAIIAAWSQQREIRTVMVFLQSHAISPSFALKIWRTYGERAIDRIQDNPYRLARDIHGIGFKTADAIARHAGIEHDALVRLAAGLDYLLAQAQGDGHLYLPLPLLFAQAAELLEVSGDALGAALEALVHEEVVEVEPGDGNEARPPAVWRRTAWRAEVEAARHVERLLNGGRLVPPAPLEDWLDGVETEMGLVLATQQRQAALAPFGHKLTAITGGPGTGKTTIVRAVCALAERLGCRARLAAPTGRAARRLADACAQPAFTVHRLLDYSFKESGFQRDEERPLELDLLIVDEASMIDTYLFRSILRALPDTASLMLVGDRDQLPSVGPGQVLTDVIASGVAEIVRLDEIFRQAQTSAIVRNAHRINAGLMPQDPPRRADRLTDFYTIAATDPAQAQRLVLELVAGGRIERAFGLDPIDDLQILAPMHRGDCGCDALNRILQQAFHQGAPELVRNAGRYRVGDKVIQTRNNYQLEIFNGDTGRILAIDPTAETLTITFEGDRLVDYPFADLSELSLAYAVTVHKAQGSEYRAVVLPLLTQHYVMLQRNLLYTAVTRARDLVVLIGSERAVEKAVQDAGAHQRFSRLAHRLAACGDGR